MRDHVGAKGNNNQTLIRALISINELSFRRFFPTEQKNHIPTHSKLWNDDTGNLFSYNIKKNSFFVSFYFWFALEFIILNLLFFALNSNSHHKLLCLLFSMLLLLYYNVVFVSFAFFSKIYRSYETKEPSK